MNDDLPRRNVLAAVLAAMTLPAGSALAAMPAPILRGDDTARLPDYAGLWARMPLPFTPTEAWHLLSPTTQAEIGAVVIGMALADYVSGDMHEEADHYRRQRALKRLLRTETDRDGVRWERAVRRWLNCSARIASLLGEPEPPEVTKLRKALDEPDDGETDTQR